MAEHVVMYSRVQIGVTPPHLTRGLLRNLLFLLILDYLSPHFQSSFKLIALAAQLSVLLALARSGIPAGNPTEGGRKQLGLRASQDHCYGSSPDCQRRLSLWLPPAIRDVRGSGFVGSWHRILSNIPGIIHHSRNTCVLADILAQR